MVLTKNINFIQRLFIITIIIFLFSIKGIKCEDENENKNENATIYNKTLESACSSNLECNSACCSSKKCAETKKCEKLVTTVYIAEAALCLVFIIAFTIYLVIKLKKIKEDFRKKTSPEEVNPKQN